MKVKYLKRRFLSKEPYLKAVRFVEVTCDLLEHFVKVTCDLFDPEISISCNCIVLL